MDEPWYEVEFFRDRPVNAVCIVDRERSIRSYRLMYESAGEWKEILRREDDGREIKLERFGRIYGSKIRVEIVETNRAPSIWEFCVYDEQ